MGEMYRARDLKPEREVAIKLLSDMFATDPDRLARFQREADVLASLNHPNIAAIYGLEESEGTKALVLELVPGETLADRIGKGSIPYDDARSIVEQIAAAWKHYQILRRHKGSASVAAGSDLSGLKGLSSEFGGSFAVFEPSTIIQELV